MKGWQLSFRRPGRSHGIRTPKKIDGPGKYDIKELWGRHKDVLRRVALGQSNVEIAKDTGLCLSTVSSTRRSTLGRAYHDELQARADGVTEKLLIRIKEEAPRALAVLTGIMENHTTPEAVRARAAMDLLDRAGLGAVKRVEQRNLDLRLSLDDINELKQRAVRAGVISVEAEEVLA